jgi:hypothetical protein
MNYETLVSQYEEVQSRYEVLNDTDILDAFSIMRDSSSILANYEMMLADMGKCVFDAERLAKGTEASISCELSPKPTEGARRAICDERVIDIWKQYSDIKKKYEYLDANVHFLNRVYFDCKMIYESCIRREGIPKEKIVGR